MNLVDLWNNAQSDIKKKVGETSYETWFSTLQVKEQAPHTLIIETPDEFFKNWIIDHYQDFIKETLDHLSPCKILIEFQVNSQILKAATKTNIARLEQNFNNEYTSRSKPKTKTNLTARFTFDNFVIGSSNRFASAAGLAVAEAPAKAYNPLFIYGRVGLGKTHLLQAISHKIQELHPSLTFCYMSSEIFTNELIDNIRHRSTDKFRKKYRDIDVLLIDDIQFIAGKESTQEEFFHTFNVLHNSHKQIIITSDRPPKEISKLEERLSSRFAWGLITDIQPPNFETRVAILKKKNIQDSINVSDEIVFFIAEQIKTNIRELEGALIRVVAYSLLNDKPISLDMAKITLKDMVKETSKIISVEMIQKSVCEYFSIPLSELRAKKRNKNIVNARQIAMYLSRKLTNMSLPEIGNAFGGKDHTTVLHSYKKIESGIQQCSNMNNTVVELTTILKY